jgi:ribosomal protein S18 acetylase RimI-like enzyme
MSKVQPDNGGGACPDCGLAYSRGSASDVRLHRRVHDEAVNGHRTKLVDGFYAFSHQSPISLQNLAEAAACAARCETEYDFSSFAAIKKKFDEFNTLAILCVKGGRVCGLLVSRERECNYVARLNSFKSNRLSSWYPTEFSEVEPLPRRTIDMIWVLKKYRKQGVAKELIEAFTSHCKLKVEELAHSIPFSEDAVHLWESLGISTIFVV